MFHGPCATLALLALMALPVAGQESGPSNSDLRALDQRARDELHPNENPLEIVGREQAGNDLRSRTPALARSDRVAATVDPIEAYERALALYSEGATFHSAPAAAGPSPERRGERSRRSASAPGVDHPAAGLAPWWRSPLPVFLAGVLVLLFVYRRHGRTVH